jgi:hypothetical protein
VRHRLRPDRAGGLQHADGLLRAFRRHREGIDLTAQHVALHQIADEALVDRLAGVDLVVLGGAHGQRLAPDGGALVGAGAAGVDVDGGHRPALLAEAGDAVAGVEAAREGQGERSAWSVHSA